MSTPILPVEGLRTSERSSGEIGERTRNHTADPANKLHPRKREGGTPSLVHRLHTYRSIMSSRYLEIRLGAELLHILQQTRLQLLGRLLSARRTHFLTNH